MSKYYNQHHTGRTVFVLTVISIVLLSCGNNPQQSAMPKPSNGGATAGPTQQDSTSGISPAEDELLPHPYRVQVNAPPGVELNPGETYTYNIVIRNTGDNQDTYNITASSSLGWANLSSVPAIMTILGRNTGSFTVAVTVPRNAAPTTQDKLTITAGSQYGAVDGFTSRTTVRCPLTFTDVSQEQKTQSNEYAIYYVACRNIVSGYTDKSNGQLYFKPDAYINRAQLAQAVAVGFKLSFHTSINFTDVATNDQFYSYIEAAVDAGLMSTSSDGSFYPLDNVKRSEVVHTLVQAAGFTLYDAPTPTFSDVPITHPDYVYIETLVTVDGWLTDTNPCKSNKDYCFRPSDLMTRGELSRILRDILVP